MVKPTTALEDYVTGDGTDPRAYAPRELRETGVIVAFERYVYNRADAVEWARLHGVTQILPVTIINHPDRAGALVGFGITRQSLRLLLGLVENALDS